METENDNIEETKTYRLTVGQHLSNGVLYQVGDKIKLSDASAERIGLDRLELVSKKRNMEPEEVVEKPKAKITRKEV